jgi:hypothetical protein
VRNGVAELCAELGIVLLAHSPLGGPKGARRLGDDATDVLAWLRGLSPALVPLPGATRVETAVSAASAQQRVLDDDARDRFDERWPVSRLLRVPRAERRPPDDADGEVVVLMGTPEAGKSTLVESFVGLGYERLNRDERGGRLSDLIEPLEHSLASGCRRLVLDNTYPKRRQRNEVIEAAWRHGVPARCVWLTTPLEDAQVNAVGRIVARHGRLPEVGELKTLARDDPNMFPPNALFNYRNALEPPQMTEGYTAIDEVPFERRRDPDATGRALIVEHEVLATTDVEMLRRHHDDGYLILAVSWQPGIATGRFTRADVEREFQETRDRLGLDIEYEYCPHGPGPPVCWCRRPLPGLGVVFIERHRLDPAACIFMGRNPTDRSFAERLGFQYAGRP